jgi:hypothetical protein
MNNFEMAYLLYGRELTGLSIECGEKKPPFGFRWVAFLLFILIS